jgi:hypothetical protein
MILACDTPGWSIEMFDPVSNIKCLVLPLISTQTEGVACSTRIELETALVELLR